MQQQTIKTHPISCLFDSGSDITWIHQRAIPRHITITTSGDPITGITMAGTFTLNRTVTLHGLSLPELSPTWTIQQLQARVMQLKCQYDIIYGQDYCSLFSIVLDFANHQINAHNATSNCETKYQMLLTIFLL